VTSMPQPGNAVRSNACEDEDGDAPKRRAREIEKMTMENGSRQMKMAGGYGRWWGGMTAPPRKWIGRRTGARDACPADACLHEFMRSCRKETKRNETCAHCHAMLSRETKKRNFDVQAEESCLGARITVA
jgi:hypothetical protein